MGGTLAGGLALATLTLAMISEGRATPAALNVMGAWAVRWLQTASPSALDGWYVDAALSGLAAVLGGGALLGAILAAWLVRIPEDHPLAWGILYALGLWAVLHGYVIPALNPLAEREFSTWVGVGCLVYGWALGSWLNAVQER